LRSRRPIHFSKTELDFPRVVYASVCRGSRPQLTGKA